MTNNNRETLAFLMAGPWVAQSIYAVTKLGIPDLLVNAEQHIDALAKQVEVNSDALYRVLRTLAGFNIFLEKEGRHFANTELSEFLTINHPKSCKDSVIYRIELCYLPWNNLLYSIKTGKPAFDKTFGDPLFQYLSSHIEESEIFNKAMVAQSQEAFQEVLKVYDFSNCRTLIDIGGGHGYFATAFLKHFPQAQAILFDLQPVLDEFNHTVLSEDIQSRLRLQAGDFFAAVPENGDIYFLKSIIHDWDDEYALIILKNIAKQMNIHSRLLLIEPIVPTENIRDYTFLIDLQMLIQSGGRERTKKEYENLFTQAGCILNKIYELSGIFKIIEVSLDLK